MMKIMLRWFIKIIISLLFSDILLFCAVPVHLLEVQWDPNLTYDQNLDKFHQLLEADRLIEQSNIRFREYMEEVENSTNNTNNTVEVVQHNWRQTLLERDLAEAQADNRLSVQIDRLNEDTRLRRWEEENSVQATQTVNPSNNQVSEILNGIFDRQRNEILNNPNPTNSLHLTELEGDNLNTEIVNPINNQTRLQILEERRRNETLRQNQILELLEGYTNETQYDPLSSTRVESPPNYDA